MEFLGTLVIILIATSLFGHLASRVGIPAVIGQLFVGIILGPALLNWVHANDFIHIFSEIGVIILMFIAGLESDLTLLKKYLRPSIIVALLGVLIPMVLIYPVGIVFGLTQFESLFLSVIFAATSVSISVAVMKELNLLDSKSGSTVLGAAVVDDVLAVVLLSIMVSLIGTKTGTDTQIPLALTFLEQLIYFAAIYFVMRFIAPLLARLGTKLLNPVGPTIMAMILCFGMAYIADLIGLSAVIGAFFAGIAIAQTHVAHEVDQSIEPIGYAIFIPVFFVSIGLNMSLAGIEHDLLLIIVLTIVATLTKLLGAGSGAKWAGFSSNEAYLVGAGMVSRGEMALIIAQIGYQSKLISDDYYSAIITAIILTTLLAPLLLKHAARHVNY